MSCFMHHYQNRLDSSMDMELKEVLILNEFFLHWLFYIQLENLP